MKKQIFLLALGLLFSSHVLPTTCSTSCATSCSSDCNSTCQVEHGKTRFDVTPHFQAASPELTSMYNSDALSNLNKDDKHGIVEFSVFGGKSTKCHDAAAVWLPYGHKTLTFDGSVKAHVFARVPAESVAQAIAGVVAGDQIGFATDNGNGIIADPASYKFDANKDTSKILPWNFGITFAALFEPLGVTAATAGTSTVDNLPGSGVITAPAFKSTICPTYTYSHIGAGVALRYHFSDDKAGWFGTLSTAVQHVRSNFKLNEAEVTKKTALNATNFPAVNPSATATTAANTMGIYGTSTLVNTITPLIPGWNTFVTDVDVASTTAGVGSINEAYLIQTTGFPTDATGAKVVAPNNVEEAFAQSAWNYGKVGCEQKITRLADIELSLGYQWHCGDCAATNWYVGVVIPTGNKAKAEFIAPAVVGNGQHAGIMMGSQTDLMLSDGEDYATWYRCDINSRYLFRNTQKASFDLLGNEWSRYMMVWANKAAYTAAVAAANTITTGVSVGASGLATQSRGAAQRAYTPGINVFTTDFYVKPQFQGRINQAVSFQGEKFRAELGWTAFARQKDCVELACEWNDAPAFADASYVGGVGLNNNRTIYNDAQTASANVVDNLMRTSTVAPAGLVTLTTNTLSDTNYADFAISSDEINYDSVATPGAITHTPYLSLGYAFESDWKPVVAIGASYEFTSSNRALNQWLVWGKFEIGF